MRSGGPRSAATRRNRASGDGQPDRLRRVGRYAAGLQRPFRDARGRMGAVCRRHARRSGLEPGRVPELREHHRARRGGRGCRGGATGERGSLTPRVACRLGGFDAASPTERRIAFALAGVSVLVLVIGLANAATLLLVRGTRRRREAPSGRHSARRAGRLFARVLLEPRDSGVDGDGRRPVL